MTGHPRILLAATLRWPLAARLAIAFRERGCHVEAWCPRGHALEKTRAVGRIHRGSALAPLRSLSAAIRAAAPDFIIPCDDEAAIHLQRLHQRHGAADERSLIERSLGNPASCLLATARGALARVARAEGVRVPRTWSLASVADLDAACAQGALPAVLKVDGSWGGLGVTVVRDLNEARAAFERATHPPLMEALLHLVLRRDPLPMLHRFTQAPAGIVLQDFIEGAPANRAVACWRGEVLAGISVMALQTRSPTGPATVVRVIDNEEMTQAAQRLVRALGLSGFCGLDFVIDSNGAASLIEMNPRATPIAHLSLGNGRDLPAALHACLGGEAALAEPSMLSGDVIALFPGEWNRDPASPHLRTAFHDVPWGETELVRDCVALPWEERGIAARLRALFKPGRTRRPVGLPRPELWPQSEPAPEK